MLTQKTAMYMYMDMLMCMDTCMCIHSVSCAKKRERMAVSLP